MGWHLIRSSRKSRIRKIVNEHGFSYLCRSSELRRQVLVSCWSFMLYISCCLTSGVGHSFPSPPSDTTVKVICKEFEISSSNVHKSTEYFFILTSSVPAFSIYSELAFAVTCNACLSHCQGGIRSHQKQLLWFFGLQESSRCKSSLSVAMQSTKMLQTRWVARQYGLWLQFFYKLDAKWVHHEYETVRANFIGPVYTTPMRPGYWQSGWD